MAMLLSTTNSSPLLVCKMAICSGLLNRKLSRLSLRNIHRMLNSR